LNSECPTTKIFAYPAYNHTSGLNDNDISIGLKMNPISYGYYAKKFQFSYEDLRPGATIADSEPSTHGTFETSTDVRYTAAFGGKADISQRLSNNRDL